MDGDKDRTKLGNEERETGESEAVKDYFARESLLC